MTSRTAIKWVGLALAGLLVAAGVAIAASNLASRQIGLASEPISAGDALAPTAASNQGHGSQSSGHGHGDWTTTAPTGTTTSTTPEPESPIQTSPAEPEPTVPTTPSHDSGDDHGSGGHSADD